MKRDEDEGQSPNGAFGTRLLVSVRDADEAVMAVDAGADLIDIKEPNHGSLGAASPSVIQEIADRVGGRVPVSVALGELIAGTGDSPSSGSNLARYIDPRVEHPAIRLAKFGLSGCRGLDDWPSRWAAAVERLPSHVRPVAVQYADWHSASAPPFAELLSRAAEMDCAAMLVDTFDKSQGSLLSHWTLGEVTRFVEAAHEYGMMAVVAGSLDRASIDRVIDAGPDVIAVRGAVCDGDRTSRLDARKIQALLRAVVGASPLAGKTQKPVGIRPSWLV